MSRLTAGGWAAVAVASFALACIAPAEEARSAFSIIGCLFLSGTIVSVRSLR